MAACPLLGVGLVVRTVHLPKQDIVLLKSILEASENLGSVFADRDGDPVVAAPTSRAAELDQLLMDLAVEYGIAFHRADDRT